MNVHCTIIICTKTFNCFGLNFIWLDENIECLITLLTNFIIIRDVKQNPVLETTSSSTSSTNEIRIYFFSFS